MGSSLLTFLSLVFFIEKLKIIIVISKGFFGLNEIVSVIYLTQCLTHSKWSKNYVILFVIVVISISFIES